MNRTVKLVLSVATALAVLFGVTTLAYSAGTSTTPKIHACVAKATGYSTALKVKYLYGQTRIVSASKSCYSFEYRTALAGWVAPPPAGQVTWTFDEPAEPLEGVVMKKTIANVAAGESITLDELTYTADWDSAGCGAGGEFSTNRRMEVRLTDNAGGGSSQGFYLPTYKTRTADEASILELVWHCDEYHGTPAVSGTVKYH